MFDAVSDGTNQKMVTARLVWTVIKTKKEREETL